MLEIFKTVLLLSAQGAGAVLILIILKPLTVKKFPARWQYQIWLVVTVCMIIPVWKFIPQKDVQRFAPIGQTEQSQAPQNEGNTETVIIDNTPIEYREVSVGKSASIRIYDLIAYVWLGGAALFLCLALGSYYVFLFKKRKGSVDLKENEAFDEIKKELGINRHIRLRVSKDNASPMLVGTLFPVVYIPGTDALKQEEEMIFRHELTHYKHGDLFYKWLTLFVNAVHWFNPLAYLLSANVTEACEVACDMAVIKNLTDEQQRLYMETILSLVEKRRK